MIPLCFDCWLPMRRNGTSKGTYGAVKLLLWWECGGCGARIQYTPPRRTTP